MDNLTRRALWNVVSAVERLKDGESITREELVDALRQPRDPDDAPSDAVLRHAYRHHILRAGVKNADDVVTYELAAELAGKKVEAIRQAAYRRRLVRLVAYRDGRERTGVTLRSLAEWSGWSGDEMKAAARKVEAADGYLSGRAVRFP